VILVPTNTSSYSNGQAPAQEIAASRLQALEEGRYVLQAAPTGYSAVISPSGVVLDRSALSTPGVIEATVPAIGSDTPYETLGDLPVLIGALALLALGWAVAGVSLPSNPIRRRRRRSPSR
jgi:apolipoprotein N-acyltransferase